MTRKPTRPDNGEGCYPSGSERRMHRRVPPGYWRQHAWKRGMDATREALAGGHGTCQLTAREGQVRPVRVAERPTVPGKPGNAGGGKGPQVRSDVQREKGLGSGSAYYPEQ